MSEPPKENPAIREESQGDEGSKQLPSRRQPSDRIAARSDRTSSARLSDDMSDNKPEYLTSVSKWDSGVTPQCPSGAVGGFSLGAVGGTPHPTPSALTVFHRCAPNILVGVTPLNRSDFPIKNEKGYARDAAHYRSLAPLRFFSFFRTLHGRLSRRVPVTPFPGAAAGTGVPPRRLRPSVLSYRGQGTKVPLPTFLFRIQLHQRTNN